MRAPVTGPCWRRGRLSASWRALRRRLRRLDPGGRSASPSTSMDVGVTFAPAGHVLGSAQIWSRTDGGDPHRRLGRLQARRRPDLRGFEPVTCDVFITEATFGLPVFRHPAAGEGDRASSCVRRAVSRARPCRRRLCARQGAAHGRASARRRIRAADLHPWRHGRAQRSSMSEGRRARRNRCGDGRAGAAGTRRRDRHLPAERHPGSWSRRFADPVTCVRIGLDAGAGAGASAGGVELPLVISDHADWDELCATILETGAGEVWVTHGREEALVHWCELQGVRARPLRIVGYGEEEADLTRRRRESGGRADLT